MPSVSRLDKNGRLPAPGGTIYGLGAPWALALGDAGFLTLDRAGATWGVLAILLLVGCVIMFLKSRYEGAGFLLQKKIDLVHKATEQVLAASDRQEVLDVITSAGPEVLDVNAASVLLMSGQTRQLTYMGSSTRESRQPVALNAISGPTTCFRAGETTDVPDAESCPFLDKEQVAKRKQRSLLFVPVMSGDKCIGVLEFEDTKRKRLFAPEERFRGEHLAKLTALGLRLCEQRQMVEQLHRTEKLAAVGELANAMAEELRAPFDQMEKTAGNVPFGAAPQDLKDRLRTITKLIDRASGSIDRLVRFATPDSGSAEQVDLNALLRELLTELRRGMGPEQPKIKLGLSKRSAIVLADPTQLRQIFQILVRHALHYLERIQGRTLQIHTAIQNGRVVTAMGPMAQPDQPIRTSLANRDGEEEASSLGLSVCQSLIERAGGTLQIERSATLGFRIEVEYPSFSKETGTEESLSLSSAGARSGAMTALVVDPDEAVRAALVQSLAAQSYRAIPVSTGDQALEMAQKMRFDWVFCDLRLQPISALDVYQQTRDRVERFVFLADEASLSQNPEIFREEGRAVLRKPFSPEDVEQLIERLQTRSVVFQDG